MQLALVLLAAAISPGDARRGAEVLKNQQCLGCHEIDGKGGDIAPDLGKTAARAYNPSLLASLMWNHAPRMWPRMEREGIPRPKLSEQDAADLFAYFYAFRFFDQPGDAARGAQEFKAKRCSDCHSLAQPGPEGAPPVKSWTSLGDPIALASAMWNHAPRMKESMAKRKIAWPAMSSQAFTDILVYARNTPGAAVPAREYSTGPAGPGEQLFAAKGCKNCHAGKLELTGTIRGRTPADFAASMWNHAPRMDTPALTAAEMRSLNSYLWSIQYFEPAGNPARGLRQYRAKGCAVCHDDASSGAPKLAGSSINNIAFVAVLWRHGPEMLERMKAKGIAWPRFQNEQLADLLAYIQARR